MRVMGLSIAGAALMFGLAMTPAQAAPGGLAPLGSVVNSESMVQKTHGWHSYCSRDRRGWGHRHVRGGRTVSCGQRARPRHWRGGRHCYFNRRGVRVCVRR